MKKLQYVKTIITDTALLSDRADEIDVEEDKELVAQIILELKDTILADKNIAALAAPQIGYKYRIFCINFDGDIRTFINPIITDVEGTCLVRESCPSLPDREFVIPRNESIVAIYQTGDILPEANRFKDIAAAVFQQQVNLLDGVLISDYGLEIDENFDKATEEERNELLDFYVESLKEYTEKCNAEIEENAELKQISDAIDFINKVSTGEVTLMPKEDDEDENSSDSNLVC